MDQPLTLQTGTGANATAGVLKGKKDREVWIDYAKSIGIVSVIVAHMALANALALNFIYTFIMPLFFLISGYLYKRKDTFGLAVGKDVKRLLLPYVYFYIISYAYWFVVIYSKHKNQFPGSFAQAGVIKPMLGMLIGVGYETDFSISINHPLWFLMALFFVKVIYSALEGIAKDNKVTIGVGVLVLFVLVWLLRTNGYHIWFSIDSALVALPFFYLGVVIKSAGIIKTWFKNNVLNLACFIVLTAATILVGKYNGSPDVNTATWGNNVFLYFAGGLVGTFMIFTLCFLFEKWPNRLILFISANTLVLMCIQSILKSISIAILKAGHFALPAKLNFMQAAVLTTLIVVLSLPVMYLIDKYLPFLAGASKAKTKAEPVSVSK
ncbi:acyltransferase family protein [Mucilaginibacter celer]|uniref:Acyltransferase 3 domain-containing protein n=1 Tax=Mucilaginibacter celer TaxID=2305508 RepID=A0A494W034_9SPHI|nr:acyltransferase family protein [Mucilaginibacter celer]AYL97113.1 hypothetical protein HYN43_018155 [Mucilaginibacter celer]